MPTIVRYVNTASSGGDGTTNGTSGATAAYATLSAAEAALRQDLNLVTPDIADQDGTPNVIALRIYVQGSAADTTAVSFSNASWSTASNKRIEIILNGTSSGAKWDTSIYRLSGAPGYGTGSIFIGKALHMDFVNIQVENTTARDNAPQGFRIGDFAADVRIYGGFIRTTGTTGAWDQNGALTLDSPNVAVSLKVRNTVLACADGYAFYNFNANSVAATIWLYNVTMVNRSATNRSVVNFVNFSATASIRVKNLLIQGTTGATNLYTNSYADESATILTEDASSPDAALDSKVVSFVDEANWDYHLDAADTAAKDAGTDLSADANWPFSIDGDGVTRTGTWDIGADEVPAGSSGSDSTRVSMSESSANLIRISIIEETS